MIKKFTLLSLFAITTLFANQGQEQTVEETNTEFQTKPKSTFLETPQEITTVETTTGEEKDPSLVEDSQIDYEEIDNSEEVVEEIHEVAKTTVIETQIEQKVLNILGNEDFNTHRNLINYILSKNENYQEVLAELKKNNLIKLDLNGLKVLDLTMVINNSSLKSLKIIKDSLKSLGYYNYLTKELDIKANTIIWNVHVKTEAAIDPLILSKTLKQRDSFIVDIIKEGDNSWIYYIDSENSKLYNTINLIDNDELSLKKPLKPYLIEIAEDTNALNIYSKGGNRWYPKVVFYDKELNILQTIQRDRFHRYIRLYVPYNTKYIKIDDLFSLSNIKRGMKITKE